MTQASPPLEISPEERMLIPLRAGPLTLYFGHGDLRYIRVAGREIVRRVYVAVRDENWGTVPYTLQYLDIDDQGDHFHITFTARHRQRNIAFDWDAEIVGSADGTIRYTFDGVAQSTFLRNRIGFCVLHPASWAGCACEIEDIEGNVGQGHFPTAISPHQPFKNFCAIRRHFADDISVEIRMEGDTFEMEDQRNWTDASFKTYSTPLELPFPVEVTQGTEFHQAVQIQVTDAPFAPVEALLPASVTLGSPLQLKMPQIGLMLAKEPATLSPAIAATLRRLNLSHLRVDLDPSRDDPRDKLARAWQSAQAIGARLEIALHLDESPDAELAAVAGAVEEVRPQVLRWLIFGRSANTTPPGLATAARRVLSPLTPEAEIGGGTNIYFTELNRFRPNVEELDCIAYSINPQVHAFDTLSLTETLEAQPATVASARQFAGGRPIVISPITLRPRFNPNATGPEPEPEPGSLPPDVDPRQPSQFAAAWTLGSISHLTYANVHALTYYETHGLRGILDHEGNPYPIYHVLAELAPFAGGTVVRAEFNALLQVAALGVRQDQRTRLFVVNLLHINQTVRIAGLTGTWTRTYLGDAATVDLPQAENVANVDLMPYGIALLDQTSAA